AARPPRDVNRRDGPRARRHGVRPRCPAPTREPRGSARGPPGIERRCRLGAAAQCFDQRIAAVRRRARRPPGARHRARLRDAHGEIVTGNPAARRLLRLPASGSLPPLSELFHDKAAREIVRDITAGRDVESRELTLGGHALLITGRVLPDGGTLLVLRDISDLRRLETVRRDFVANVSHELKTPLTSIAGYAETLAAEAAESEAKRFAETILANATRMQRLVDDLLDLSRIESGGWQPAPAVLDVATAARDAFTPLADRAA